MKTTRTRIQFLVLLFSIVCATCVAQEPIDHQRAAEALHRAVAFFRQQVSASGGYLWRYSEDLARREGEGRASATSAWVQPPGTPTVGGAYLRVYELTGDRYYLEAARETAHALVQGQLKSGGWDYRIEFDPADRRRYAYRVDGASDGRELRNVTTLDDDTTQSALRFLMRADQTLEMKDEKIHEAATYALQSLLRAQYPNGAWPQRYSEFPNSDEFPVRKASYSESWSRTYPAVDYRSFYTFNDNTIADMISTMFAAEEIYGEPRYRAAGEKGGDFILLAQMPDPQPAWAQQYDRDMHPAWARRFEPAAITGGESQGVLRMLLTLYRHTGKKKYLEPIPRALEYLNKSRLPDGGLARFYELRTNTPLYFTRNYELTYESNDMPTHYAFIVGSNLDSIEREYRRLLQNGPGAPRSPQRAERRVTLSRDLAARAAELVAAMDRRGAWVEDGRLRSHGDDDPTRRVIDCRTFARNIETLGAYVAATQDHSR